jgi:hypothetical protein
MKRALCATAAAVVVAATIGGWAIAASGAGSGFVGRGQTVLVASNIDVTSGPPLMLPGTFTTSKCAKVTFIVDGTPNVGVIPFVNGLVTQTAPVIEGFGSAKTGVGSTLESVPSVSFGVQGAGHLNGLWLFCSYL